MAGAVEWLVTVTALTILGSELMWERWEMQGSVAGGVTVIYVGSD